MSHLQPFWNESVQLHSIRRLTSAIHTGPYGAAGPVGGTALPPGSPSPAAPLKYPSYGAEGGLPAGPAYPAVPPSSAEAAALDSPELKYSCSMDFMRGVSAVGSCAGAE